MADTTTETGGAVAERAMVHFDELVEWIKGPASDFAVSQGSELAQEVVAFGLWNSTVSAFVYLAAGGAAILYWRWMLRSSKEQWFRDFDEPFFILCVPVTVIGIVSTIASLGAIRTAIKCAVAPRLYLIEYMAELVK